MTEGEMAIVEAIHELTINMAIGWGTLYLMMTVQFVCLVVILTKRKV